ncbi:resistance protein [Musa troglodytarum]|uniref:Resistance protein n=1 Tax=Musa troglodytarum TaxID=320322 RepID=A0A9E7EQT2_9LILI|nr:resistance protein [Musa troglodytarum]
MAEVVASSIVRFVSDKLGAKVSNELGLLKGVGEELKRLESTLAAIQDVLEDAEARQVKEKSLRVWLRKLKDVAYDLDDLLDETAVKALTKGKVRGLPLTPKSIRDRHKIAREVKEMRKRLDAIAEERAAFHLREGTARDSEPGSGGREQTGSLVDESQVYGRQQDKEQIIGFLLGDSTEHKTNLGVIAIVGLGGLGKTTLAQLVYNDEGVRRHFERRTWVYVSDKFDSKSLMRSIIESLSAKEFTLRDMDPTQRELVEQIRGRRFLLVLDDVWNEDYELWDRLRILLSNGAEGSKVVVTTRSRRVASVMNADDVHCLAGLSDDDCWLLFERRAFESGGSARNPSLVAIGKEIVRRCGGMPLAAKALGSSMRFKREVSQWVAVRDNEIWRPSSADVDDDQILPALMLSYSHLPPRLKQCFAYCAMIPKGKTMRIETLAQLWVAEGLAELEDVGSQYVDQLLSRSLLEIGKEEAHGAVSLVKMHDVIHDLARFVAGDECSIMDVCGSTATSPGSRYASLLFDGRTPSVAETLSHLRKLRALYVIVTEGIFEKYGVRVLDRKNFYQRSAEEQDEDERVLLAMFSTMKPLRALHLDGFPMKALPAAVQNLDHLRYLDLSGTDLRTLPPAIGRLHNLQILKLPRCTGLEALPESIGELVNLVTLDLCLCRRLSSLPDSIGRMGNLRNLDVSGACITTLPESLSSLSNLQLLKLRYCYWLRELPKNAQSMRSLTHLDIHGCYGLTRMPAAFGQLRQLRMLPRYVLGEGDGDGGLEELGTLNLEGELYIGNLQNLRSAAEAGEANLREKRGLRSLTLNWDPVSSLRQEDPNDVAAMGGDHTELVEDALGSLRPQPDLEELRIEGYAGKVLPGWMMDCSIPNLVELSLDSFIRCEKLPALERLSCLKVLNLSRFPCVECLPRLGQLPCLRVLRLETLPAVKRLRSESYGGGCAFPALEELRLVFMSDLEEWSGTEGEDFLPRLSELQLTDCPKLGALPSTFPFVNRLTMNVDDRLLLTHLERGAFPNLKHLGICNCDLDDEAGMAQVLVQRLASVESSSRTGRPVTCPPSAAPESAMVTQFVEFIESMME